MPQRAEDRRYLEARIERERALERSARHPEAARAHSILAAFYLDRLEAAAEPALSECVLTQSL
jgi:hypothetical protein